MSQDGELVPEPAIVAAVEMGTRLWIAAAGMFTTASPAKHNVWPVCRAAQDRLTTESLTKSDVPPDELWKGNITAQTDHKNKPG